MSIDALDALLEAARPLIDLAIAEDVGPGDATSESALPPGLVLQGRIRSKEGGVLAGLPVAEAAFRRLSPEIEFVALAVDGQEVVAGEVVADVVGPGRALLAAERTALNFLQRLSGIATHTRRFVDAVACTPARILDTRKTTPGYRTLDKHAVRMGGGVNHRQSLFDMILIKDNHIDAAGGISGAIERARAAYPALPIEVEVRDLKELREALAADPPLDRIMLDNMSLDQMRQAVALAGGRVPLEASGSITLERAPGVAGTGVDYLSVGALTHSARALDLSMKVSRLGEEPVSADPASRVAALRADLGDQVVILGHHYQRDDVIAQADLRGDSLKLAREASRTAARFLVFCGVHFMAETAAILAKPGQRVLSPDAAAGCFLADTASEDVVQAAWNELDDWFGDAEAEVTPITYVNSSAALKAFCGRHGGIVCTSGNAERAMRWALARRPRVFFFPDQHLGRNTARRLGIPPEEVRLWDDGGAQRATFSEARVFLWPGACNVHQRFLPGDVMAARTRYDGVRVIVHPECRMDVVDQADEVGSTAFIIQQVAHAPAGTQWAIGTEARLVRRLQAEHPEQRIVSLAEVPPFCRTMSQITLEKLGEVLEALTRGESRNEVTVAAETAGQARAALERMLAL